MKNLGSKIPAVQNLRHKVDLMNEILVVAGVGSATDFSMRVAYPKRPK